MKSSIYISLLFLFWGCRNDKPNKNMSFCRTFDSSTRINKKSIPKIIASTGDTFYEIRNTPMESVFLSYSNNTLKVIESNKIYNMLSFNDLDSGLLKIFTYSEYFKSSILRYSFIAKHSIGNNSIKLYLIVYPIAGDYALADLHLIEFHVYKDSGVRKINYFHPDSLDKFKKDIYIEMMDTAKLYK